MVLLMVLLTVLLTVLLMVLLILNNKDTLKALLREKEVAREKETKDGIGEEEGEEEEAAEVTTVEGVTEEGVDNLNFLSNFVAP